MRRAVPREGALINMRTAQVGNVGTVQSPTKFLKNYYYYFYSYQSTFDNYLLIIV